MLTQYPRLGEQLYRSRLENGLTVLVAPRPGFTKTLAYFATNYGSIHTRFSLDGSDHTAPAGIAHFLEHKMFELPNRDVNALFADLGANVNAFTSYDMTAYYVLCTDRFFDSLRLLLEFVSTPYFTEESVDREFGIIDQEIGMHRDSPESRVFENLMQAMYAEFPISVPILGTPESIRQITPQLLSKCHRAFYTPANMVLCVVGDVDPEKVEALAREVLGTEQAEAGQKRRLWQEAPSCSHREIRDKMEVSMPNFLLGFKSGAVEQGEAGIRREIIGDLAAEALFGESSQLYLQLYGQGLIDGSFGGGFEVAEDQSMLICGGDSENAEAVRDALWAQAELLAETGIREEDFLRMKRSALGRRIRDLDSFDSTCFRLCAYAMWDFDYFRFPEVYEKITAEDVRLFLSQLTDREKWAMSVIEPV